MDLAAEMHNDTTLRLPTPDELGRIGELAQKQLDLQIECEEMAEVLKNKQQALRVISEVELPEVMLSCNCSEFKLANGRKILVQKYYSGSISEDNAESAFSWLHAHNHDSLIKNEIKLNFGKGEDAKAAELVKTLVNAGYEPVNKVTVHPMTLKAFIKEQVESGADFPLELFHAYIGQKTIIK